jgi:hypothetical protein
MAQSILEEVRRKMSDPEFMEELRRFGRNCDYGWAHLEEWRLKYPDSWVGVFNEELVAVDENPDRLIATLEARSIPLREAFVQFIPKEKADLVL